MDVTWLRGASVALDVVWLGGGLVGAILLFGLGWVFCARVKTRQLKEIETENDRKVGKLVEKADRQRKEAFLVEKNAWYDSKAKYEETIESKRAELDTRESDLQAQEAEASGRIEVVRESERTLGRREKDAQRLENRFKRQNEELCELRQRSLYPLGD